MSNNLISPRVSILIPAYNAEKYIAECLESCLAQTFKDWEAICVNDASTDKTAEILAVYAQKDARIKVMTLEKNAGISRALDHGYRNSKGSVIAYLDSDDWWAPEHLQLCLGAMDETGADVVNTRFVSLYDGVDFCAPTRSWNEEDWWKFRLNKYELVPFFNLGPMKVFKKALYNGVIFEDNLCYLQDSCTSFQLSVNAKKSLTIPFYTYYWRIRQGSTTNSAKSPEKVLGEVERIYQIMLQFLDNKGLGAPYASIACEWKLKQLIKTIKNSIYTPAFAPHLEQIKKIVDADVNGFYLNIDEDFYNLFKTHRLDELETIFIKKGIQKKKRIKSKFYKYKILNLLTLGKNVKFTLKLQALCTMYGNVL